MHKNTGVFPGIPSGSRVLITGASGGIGQALVKAFIRQGDVYIGAHYSSPKGDLEGAIARSENVHLMKKRFRAERDCVELVDKFCGQAGGIDALVVCSGGMANPVHWKDLSEKDWEHDIFLNLSVPFYLSRAAMRHMEKGRIILFGTESALHGGGSASLAYGVAKMGVECMVKGLAREGAPKNILVNMIRPGYISTGFHQRWQKKNRKDMEARADLVPLKRAGTPEEVAALVAYLLSEWGDFITGQSFAITGGDWL
ncbi:SDR family NAD(P)-dependent oxidoreductase [Candidatus Omnitrophota bacterium]